MKNVTLIGAGGFVGTAILNELLARGHKGTAFVRNPEKISASNPDLNVVKAHVSHLQISSPAAIDAEIAEAENALASGAELFIGPVCCV